MRNAGPPSTHHHELTEIINAATPGNSELPASIMTSGVSGHEHVEPEYEAGIAPPTETAGLKLIVPFALAQMALFIALLGPVTVSMAIKVTAVVGADRAPAAQGLILGIGAIAALPHPEDSAKDLGVFNIANAMPQTLAPLLGAVLLGVGVGAGQNYDLLYLTAAALTFLGALAIIPVKNVQ
jgi:hypothetical protein